MKVIKHNIKDTGHIEAFCHVLNADGMQVVCMPDGVQIPGVTDTVVRQDLDQARTGIAEVTITLLVNISERD